LKYQDNAKEHFLDHSIRSSETHTTSHVVDEFLKQWFQILPTGCSPVLPSKLECHSDIPWFQTFEVALQLKHIVSSILFILVDYYLFFFFLILSNKLQIQLQQT
jgi:hypothetical protein